MTMLAEMAEQRAQSAERLVSLREAKRLSQEELAHAADVSTKTISRWENQRHDPERKTVERVAAALEVEPDFLWQPPSPLGLNGRSPADLQDQLDAIQESVERQERMLRAVAARLGIDPQELEVEELVELVPGATQRPAQRSPRRAASKN